jgi:hypothetical protein
MLHPTSGARTKFNQELGDGLNLRPFFQNVYKEKP